MKHYRKRNIHHPILLLDGQPIPWQRVGHTGVLAVDESVPESKGLIEYLDKVAAESPGSVQVITADVYAAQVEAEKKNPESATGPDLREPQDRRSRFGTFRKARRAIAQTVQRIRGGCGGCGKGRA